MRSRNSAAIMRRRPVRRGRRWDCEDRSDARDAHASHCVAPGASSKGNRADGTRKIMTRRSLTSAGASALLVVGLLTGCGNQSPEAQVASARQYLANGDRPAAIVQLRSALQTNPDLAAARYLLGKALFDNEDYAGAQKELRRAKALGYSPDEVIPLLAESMLRQGDFKRLTLDFAQSAKADLRTPESRAALLTTLGKAYASLGDANASKAAFESAIAAKPDYGPA